MWYIFKGADARNCDRRGCFLCDVQKYSKFTDLKEIRKAPKIRLGFSHASYSQL